MVVLSLLGALGRVSIPVGETSFVQLFMNSSSQPFIGAVMGRGVNLANAVFWRGYWGVLSIGFFFILAL